MAVDRLTQVNEALRSALGYEFNAQIELPPYTVLSVSKVRISPDLNNAMVWLVVTPTDRTGTVLTLARKHLGRVVPAVAKRIPLRRFPKLKLTIDEGAIKAAHIEALLDSLK